MNEQELTKLLNWFDALKAEIETLEWEAHAQKAKLDALCNVRFKVVDIIESLTKVNQ
jgi:hypothetical protein